MKLRTLNKIFPKSWIFKEDVENEIRKVAIKWVKDRIFKCENCNFNNIIDYKTKPIICNEHKFWMERFNVIDEDLK